MTDTKQTLNDVCCALITNSTFPADEAKCAAEAIDAHVRAVFAEERARIAASGVAVDALAEAKRRARDAAHALIEEIGGPSAEWVDETAARAAAEIRALRAKLAEAEHERNSAERHASDASHALFDVIGGPKAEYVDVTANRAAAEIRVLRKAAALDLLKLHDVLRWVSANVGIPGRHGITQLAIGKMAQDLLTALDAQPEQPQVEPLQNLQQLEPAADERGEVLRDELYACSCVPGCFDAERVWRRCCDGCRCRKLHKPAADDRGGEVPCCPVCRTRGRVSPMTLALGMLTCASCKSHIPPDAVRAVHALDAGDGLRERLAEVVDKLTREMGLYTSGSESDTGPTYSNGRWMSYSYARQWIRDALAGTGGA